MKKYNVSMSFGNSCFVVTAGLLAMPFVTQREKPIPAKPIPVKPIYVKHKATVAKVDPRSARLGRFLAKLHCPVANLANDFVTAADKNKLDWRLLPSISIVESGGGKAARNNNIFGWGNGNLKFPSIKAGLQEVAFRLGRSPLYRNHNSAGKLKVYNPDQEYASRVLDVMNRISPAT